jgi:hypothetical protein
MHDSDGDIHWRLGNALGQRVGVPPVSPEPAFLSPVLSIGPLFIAGAPGGLPEGLRADPGPQ